MIEYLNQRLQIRLPEEEAGNIAFHLVNAQTENPNIEQTIQEVRMLKDIFNIVQKINEQGTTVLLVEQNATLALSIAHRGYVMETGNIVMEDKACNLMDNESVKAAYLGF